MKEGICIKRVKKREIPKPRSTKRIVKGESWLEDLSTLREIIEFISYVKSGSGFENLDNLAWRKFWTGSHLSGEQRQTIKVF